MSKAFLFYDSVIKNGSPGLLEQQSRAAQIRLCSTNGTEGLTKEYVIHGESESWKADLNILDWLRSRRDTEAERCFICCEEPKMNPDSKECLVQNLKHSPQSAPSAVDGQAKINATFFSK